MNLESHTHADPAGAGHPHHAATAHHGHAEAGAPPDPRRWLILALLCTAQFMLIVDVTVVNVALPTIGGELGLNAGALTWVVTAYTLFFGSLLLLGGRLGDLLGRRRMFLVGLTLFTAASLASGLAESGGILITARAVQGIGAAVMSPAAMALIMTVFQGPERNRALGVWAAIGATGAAFGVLLGGVLVSGPGWESIFFVNVPIGLAVLVAVPALVKETTTAGHGTGHAAAHGQHEHGQSHGHGHAAAPTGFDLPGALTMTATPALLIYGLAQARDNGFGDIGAWLPLLGALLGAVLFVVAERSAAAPLVRLPFLARRSLIGGCLLMLAASGVLISAFFLCSLYLQHVLGFSALRTGLTFLPAALATLVGAHLGSQAVARLGWRATATGGMAVAVAGALLLTGLERDGNAWTQVMPGFILLSFGLGIGFVCAITSSMHGVEHKDAGLGSGLVNTCHELGASLGIAVVAAVAGASLEGTTPSVDGFGSAFTTCAVIAAVAAVAGLTLLPKGRPDPSAGPVFAH
ncbi:MFS transporter [Streptomyces sp. NBC_00347]|uniref:MFS transporter n=1 Tax=Streptomyces sp. NBC_00347 TaxID=2975721 RepID=UPI00224EA8FA|nr:MFS transporter [Streptomyces sp. NBC_00347]MCX5127238.1 MFS transporter [Streptomyces sp. NBC_00347]